MLIALAIIAVVFVAFLGFVVTRPDEFAVQRSTVISASPERIFPLINDFHRWENWSPYDKIDPALQRTYSGSISGAGAVYEWRGNSQVGTGRMEIRTATAPNLIVIDLHFLKPFEGRNIAEFTMEPAGARTRVTWAMHGPLAFVPKMFGVFMPMDRMIGKSFETGLANLKTLAES